MERTIHRHFYHTDFNNFNEGWSYWERFSPLVFEVETLSKYGSFAGIISALNEYKKLHPVIFEKFNQCSKEDNHDKKNESSFSKELQQMRVSKPLNIFLKSLLLDIVIDHFKVLFETKNKRGEPYLTEEKFILFIKKAFLGEQISSKIKFNLDPRSKGKIVSLFYTFYSKCIDYENTNQKREKYIHLLSDNFEGWKFEQVKQNFKSVTKHKLQ